MLLTLVALEQHPGSSEDLTSKCRRALKALVPKLTCLPALDALVHQQLPESAMKLVLEQVRAGCGACFEGSLRAHETAAADLTTALTLRPSAASA